MKVDITPLLDGLERVTNYLEVRGFCPTGQGGGTDNSCGSGGGGGAKPSGGEPGYTSGSWGKENPKTRMPVEKMEKIASKHFGRKDLKERNMDSDDFFESSRWGTASALHDAYKAGGGKRSSGAMFSKYEKIASKRLGIDSLKKQNSSADFYEASVIGVRDGLNDAYKLGRGKKT